MEVKDWPHADFSGIMIDCVRQDMPITAVKDAVIAARFWKIRYLHLHILEDSAFIFPMRAFKSGTSNGACFNGDQPRVWDREELKKLVAFADARGVTLVPEIETPGHCGALLRDVPDIEAGRLLDMSKEKSYQVLQQIVDEVCDVFKSSPYFHIGGDEIEPAWFIGRPETIEFLKNRNMREKDKGGWEDILAYHVLRMNEMVKKHGKKTIFWGGWQGPPQIPALNDCISYSWFRNARQAQDAGMATITVPWDCFDPFPKWNMYSSNECKLKRTDRVLGASRMMWEQSAETITNRWLGGMGDRQERTWGPDTPMFEPEYRDRLKLCIARMDKLVRPVRIQEDVKVIERNGERQFYGEPATITMTAELPQGCAIRWTIDGSEPKPASAKYEGPLKLTGKLRVRAAMFDQSGTMVGGVTFGEKYDYRNQEKNLATGKPVKVSGIAGQGKDAEVGENANDGWVGNGKLWGAWDPPQWWQVDLQGNHNLDRIRLFPYDHGGRVFQFTIEVSTDEKNWTRVVDESKNDKPEMGQGHEFKFKPAQGRYVRVNMLKNSIQNAVQLEEVRVYEVGK
jgi:hypothetical protein